MNSQPRRFALRARFNTPVAYKRDQRLVSIRCSAGVKEGDFGAFVWFALGAIFPLCHFDDSRSLGVNRACCPACCDCCGGGYAAVFIGFHAALSAICHSKAGDFGWNPVWSWNRTRYWRWGFDENTLSSGIARAAWYWCIVSNLWPASSKFFDVGAATCTSLCRGFGGFLIKWWSFSRCTDCYGDFGRARFGTFGAIDACAHKGKCGNQWLYRVERFITWIFSPTWPHRFYKPLAIIWSDRVSRYLF